MVKLNCIRFFLSVLFLSFLVGCTGRTDGDGRGPEKNTGDAAFVFQEEFHNFGSLQAGEIVVYSFPVQNTGTRDLFIEHAETGCGCITVDYPDAAIKPGETAYVDVTFNSGGETGKIYKEIVITTNAAEKKEAKLAVAAHVKNEMINIYSAN